MMNDRLKKAMVALLAVAMVGACSDPPVDVAPEDASRLTTNPSFLTIRAGSSETVSAFLQNDLGQYVAGNVSFSACNALISLADDADQLEVEPGTNAVVTAVTLGESCIVVSGAGFTDTIGVRVVPDAIVATSAPETVRAGETGSIDLDLRTTGNTSVGPFTDSDATFTSSNEARLFFTDDAGGFDTRLAGPVTVTVTYELLGVTRTVAVPITVLPGAPATGSLAAFAGATQPGDTVAAIGTVRDTIGNINDLASDITGLTVTSSDPGVATAFGVVSANPDPAAEGRVILTIYAVGVSGGVADITASAQTTSGTISLGTRPVTVLSPTLVAATPNMGQPGQIVVLTGTGLAATGFTTNVFMDGTDITRFVDSATPSAVTLDMPGAADGAHAITVSVGGVPSTNSTTWTQTSFDDIYGPANESPTTAPVLTLPIDLAGTLAGANSNDYYRFTLAASTAMTFRLDWDNDKDLDMLFRNDANTAYVCSFGAATGAHPENATCTLAAGTYIINVNDYSSDADGDTSPVTYELRAF